MPLQRLPADPDRQFHHQTKLPMTSGGRYFSRLLVVGPENSRGPLSIHS